MVDFINLGAAVSKMLLSETMRLTCPENRTSRIRCLKTHLEIYVRKTGHSRHPAPRVISDILFGRLSVRNRAVRFFIQIMVPVTDRLVISRPAQATANL